MNIEKLTLFKADNIAVLRSRIVRIYLLAFLIAISCIGCDREFPQYPRVISDMHISQERVKIYITEDRPALVIVEFSGYAGGCIGYDSTGWRWDGNTCYIEVKQSDFDPRETGYDCPDDASFYTEQIIIGTLDIGDYNININNQHTQEFQILPLTECEPIETASQ